MKVACYCRVAANGQETAMDMQKAALEQFASARNYEDGLIFEDSGPGVDLRRPGLNALLHAADRQEFDVLIVKNVSRLARRPMDALRILDHLRKSGVRIWSVSEGDLLVPERLIIYSAMMELESTTHEKRMRHENTDR